MIARRIFLASLFHLFTDERNTMLEQLEPAR
jgi:hypothetical protein